MSALMEPRPIASALSVRLSRLARLEPVELEALIRFGRDTRRSPAKREILAEGDPIQEPRAIVSGWACRQRVMSDGRRQILSFLLPGDLIGVCRHSNPVASTSILAVTELVTCLIPRAEFASSGLAQAYRVSATLEEHHFLAQITRLGRLSALERVADWILETQERLAFAGISTSDTLPVPLTQEFLADALGLTIVHVNRTLQTMRREGLLTFHKGTIVLLDPVRLKNMIDYRPARYPPAGTREMIAS